MRTLTLICAVAALAATALACPAQAYCRGCVVESQRADLGRAIDRTRQLIDELSGLIAQQFRATFAALELCYAEPASPRALALAIALYSYVTWFGMAAYGRRTWAQRGEAFTIYFDGRIPTP